MITAVGMISIYSNPIPIYSIHFISFQTRPASIQTHTHDIDNP